MTALMAIAFTLIAATAPWISVDDSVMGGRSASRAVRTGDSTLVFVGEVSLDNNGGFASIRTAPQQHDLAGATGIVLRVRGDGKRYRVNLRTDATFDGIQYQAGFITIDDTWQDIRLDFAAPQGSPRMLRPLGGKPRRSEGLGGASTPFDPRFRGRPVPDAPHLDPARIRSFGLAIAERQAGPFRLEIDTITSWVADPP